MVPPIPHARGQVIGKLVGRLIDYNISQVIYEVIITVHWVIGPLLDCFIGWSLRPAGRAIFSPIPHARGQMVGKLVGRSID